MKVDIVYFSGTGNTKLISEEICRNFSTEGQTRLFTAEDFLKGEIKFEPYIPGSLLGIGFPVYDLSAPEIILRLIHALPAAKQQIPVFIFSTMAFIKGDCHSIIAKALSAKGYLTISKKSFLCPSNGVSLYEKPGHGRFKNVRFEKDIESKIKSFVRKTGRNLDRFIKDGCHEKGAVLPFFNILRYFSEKLYGDKYYQNLQISSACNSCGICADRCPDKNIAFQEGKVKVINDNGCMRCLRCVSNCPKKAINFTSSPRYGEYNKVTIKKLYHIANSKS